MYDEVRQELDERVKGMTINAATIMQVLKFAMEVVEATQLKGDEQCKLCIKLVKDVIIAAPISGKEEQLLLDMIDNGVLDLVVLSKQELSFVKKRGLSPLIISSYRPLPVSDPPDPVFPPTCQTRPSPHTYTTISA